MENYILNIDYLQLFGIMKYRDFSIDVSVELQPFGSRHFSRIEKIMLNGEYIAVLESEARSVILKEKSAMLKIENHVLYEKNCWLKIDAVIRGLGFKVMNISRLDIALDLINFKNKLSPKDLINGFVKEKYLRNGRGKFMLIGSQKDVRDVEYLRFGSRKSPINTYLYNKSLEMREVKLKQHIIESWKNINADETIDVWRLEHSLKSEALTHLDETSGEIIKIDYEKIKDNKFIKALFFSLTKKYFQFKMNDNTKNKTRMKTLQLFDMENAYFQRINFTTKKDATKADKILMKRLHQFTDMNINAGNKERHYAESLLDFMKNDPYLERYYHQKVHHWNEESGEKINKSERNRKNSIV